MVQHLFATSWFKRITATRYLLILIFLFPLLFLCACGSGIYHTVKPGQTLYRISKTYAVNETYLARVNRIKDPTQIKIGKRLYIPGAKRRLSVPVIKPKVARTTKKKVTRSTKAKVTKTTKKRVAKPKKWVAKPKKTKLTKPAKAKLKKPVRKKVVPTKPKTKKKSPKKSKATSVKKLRWPLRGKIVRSFSTQAKAGGGKGIEIAVRSGSSVVAAEAGKVIYGGDGVNGYGFLVILQHENDFFTVYGFNSKNTVRQGDFVSKGEQIALSGTPPSGGQARLHFEVRKGKRAVNPILYLP